MTSRAAAAKRYSAEERHWFAAVRELDRCMLCGSAHGLQVAHRDYGKGTGMKTKPWETTLLCAECHRELTDGTAFDRAQKRALMDRAIVNAHSEMIAAGALQLGAIGLVA